MPPIDLTACKFNRLSRRLGLELEIGHWKNLDKYRTKTFPQFNIVHDGSVRPSGLEMTIAPLYGDKFLVAMTELGEALYTHKCEVNHTCGLHVHVDGTNLSYWAIQRLMQIYLGLEEFIYGRLAGLGRQTNSFCRSFDLKERQNAMHVVGAQTNEELRTRFYEFLYGITPIPSSMIKSSKGSYPVSATCPTCARYVPCPVRSFSQYWICNRCGRQEKKAHCALQAHQAQLVLQSKQHKYGQVHREREHNSRYLGLNLHSWLYRGTIEFRMKEGTVDFSELLCWPLFCGWIVELASTLTPNQVTLGLAGGPQSFIDQYFPAPIATWAANKQWQTT